MSSALTKVEEEELMVNETDMTALAKKPPQSMTSMDLLAVALSKDAAIDVIERLAVLHEKAQARQAEIEFNDAMNRVQSQIKRIAPDMENPDKHNKYASYAAIDRVIRPIYTPEGFSLSFSSEDCPLPDHVRIICWVSRGAHTRKYQKDMPVDTKGPKGGDVMTKAHANGAADSYAKRYLVKDIFNIAIGEEDTDGNSVTTMGELVEMQEWLANCRNMDELQKQFAACYRKVRATNDRAAMQALIAAKDKRKAELR